MSETLFGLDMAWDQVVAARGQNDTSAEAKSLSLLEQELHDVGRHREADLVGEQAVDLAERCLDRREILLARADLWMRRGARFEELGVNGYYHSLRDFKSLREAARDAYIEARKTFYMVADAPEQIEEAHQHIQAVDQRVWPREAALKAELEARRRSDSSRARARSSGPGPSRETVELVIAGFLAVKALGPFVEEWAKTLGGRLGESTVRALARIRLRRVGETRQGVTVGGTQLEASVPGTYSPTVLVLPNPLSDAAKLAVFDFDPADEAVRGKTLYWSERDGEWLSLQERFTRFRARHPEVTVSEDGQHASWTEHDGPHSVGCESLPWMIGYLEAKFD
jgi:hypothetical protein